MPRQQRPPNLFYANGTVYCLNGGPVVGIWVYVNDGGTNGWAGYTQIGSNSASYSYGLGSHPSRILACCRLRRYPKPLGNHQLRRAVFWPNPRNSLGCILR